jgi:hypothetical protein
VNRTIEALARKGLLMQGSIWISVEEAAELIFKFMNAFDGSYAEAPSKILAGKPFPTNDRVHEVALDRVTGRKSYVVTALDHPSAAALSKQSLDRDSHVKIWIGLFRVQGSEEPGTTGPEDQDVGLLTINSHLRTPG